MNLYSNKTTLNSESNVDELAPEKSESFIEWSESFRDKHPDWEKVFPNNHIDCIQDPQTLITNVEISPYSNLNMFILSWDFFFFLFLFLILIFIFAGNILRVIFNKITQSKDSKSSNNESNQLTAQSEIGDTITINNNSNDGDDNDPNRNPNSNHNKPKDKYDESILTFIEFVWQALKLLKRLRRLEQYGKDPSSRDMVLIGSFDFSSLLETFREEEIQKYILEAAEGCHAYTDILFFLNKFITGCIKENVNMSMYSYYTWLANSEHLDDIITRLENLVETLRSNYSNKN